jgi:hypothetical protein
MTTPGLHPDLLAFVAGHLSSDEKAEVVRHLRECEPCAEEERSLRSLRRSLASAPGVHLSVEELVALEERGDRAVVDPRVAAHLAQCADCRADLEALAVARRRHSLQQETARPEMPRRGPAGRRISGTRPLVAAGLGAALLGGLLAWRLGVLPGPVPPDSRRSSPSSAPLLPPTRGVAAPAVVVSGTRTILHVGLPFGAPGGAYDARVEGPRGEVVGRAETSVLKDGEVLEIRFDAPVSPGPYRLVVLSSNDGVAAPITYPLQVVGGLRTGPSGH